MPSWGKGLVTRQGQTDRTVAGLLDETDHDLSSTWPVPACFSSVPGTEMGSQILSLKSLFLVISFVFL